MSHCCGFSLHGELLLVGFYMSHCGLSQLHCRYSLSCGTFAYWVFHSHCGFSLLFGTCDHQMFLTTLWIFPITWCIFSVLLTFFYHIVDFPCVLELLLKRFSLSCCGFSLTCGTFAHSGFPSFMELLPIRFSLSQYVFPHHMVVFPCYFRDFHFHVQPMPT